MPETLICHRQNQHQLECLLCIMVSFNFTTSSQGSVGYRNCPSSTVGWWWIHRLRLQIESRPFWLLTSVLHRGFLLPDPTVMSVSVHRIWSRISGQGFSSWTASDSSEEASPKHCHQMQPQRLDPLALGRAKVSAFLKEISQEVQPFTPVKNPYP